MNKPNYRFRKVIALVLWIVIAVSCVILAQYFPKMKLSSGQSVFDLAAIMALILAISNLLTLITIGVFKMRNKPAVEGVMIGKMYMLMALIAIVISVASGIGRLATFGTFFSLFGGMLLGWSLQAPVSGFAAWILVSIKRPFRPGDRIQLPNLNLTGDIQELGPMYTVLNQVGGSIGSEEAVGRYILLPNAMLFSQVVINYTVTQEADNILDEVVIRITYNSDWKRAEQILLDAAREVTAAIITKTGQQPYIRSDLYDYGVYLRLRYLTRVTDRAETSYEITKRIFTACQYEEAVDFAIPFVYSNRAAAQKKDGEALALQDRESQRVKEVRIDRITSPEGEVDSDDLNQLVESIKSNGLLQPIVLAQNPAQDGYDVLAGDMRLAACRKLGWKTVPAIIQNEVGRGNM